MDPGKRGKVHHSSEGGVTSNSLGTRFRNLYGNEYEKQKVTWCFSPLYYGRLIYIQPVVCWNLEWLEEQARQEKALIRQKRKVVYEWL